MMQAMSFFFQIVIDTWDFIFNRWRIFGGAYIGWIFLTILVFNVLLRSLLALPRSAPRVRNKNK